MGVTSHVYGWSDEEIAEFDAEDARIQKIRDDAEEREFSRPITIQKGDIWRRNGSKREYYCLGDSNRPNIIIFMYGTTRKEGTRTPRRVTAPHLRKNFGAPGAQGYTLVERDGRRLDLDAP